MHHTIFTLGPIAIRAYALMLCVAFLVGAFLAVKRAKKFGITPHEVISVVTVIIITSIAGSRILYVLEHIRSFTASPGSFFHVTGGGLSYHGGLLFACVGVLWWVRRRKASAGIVFDIITPAVALGFFFVRIGCFLNGCCFGTPTDLPWGVVFPPDSPAGWVYANATIHPTQLYSSFAGLMVFLVLLRLEKKGSFARGSGSLFFSFLILSALCRFVIEFFRYHDSYALVTGSFSLAQAYCVAILLFSGTMMIVTRRKREDLSSTHPQIG
jgi:phosphatidylglycerol:prolipoprotein diacylglycerol transferase